MPITPGTRLGSYQVIAAIGAGGMGEVYRARDTKLDRDVALKILPAGLTSDPERLGRFRREARVLASLNHPNIAHIYDFDETAGAFLVLELVEGPTLADRMAEGPMSVAEALPIARQIAEALEAAHDQAIIHRDLKPANVKVREDGRVKVLDFGLAKALVPDDGSTSAETMNSPTLTARATQLGVILGTAAYMAPEQARGKAVDRRADVWAFGVVLYEMLTGRRAFQGDDISDVLAAVLKDTPPLDRLPADTPPSIRRLLRRCLKKDRRERLADLSAARLEITEALAGESDAPVGPLREGRRRLVLPAIAGVLVALAGTAGWWLKPAAAVQTLQVVRSSIPLPIGSNWSRVGRHVIAISPDGSHVAYIMDSKLFLRALDRFEPAPITTVIDPAEVFFSPDSAWIGFVADGKLQKVAVTGGAPVPLCACPLPLGASWGGRHVLFGQEGGIYRISDTGGTPELVIAAQPGERLARPQLLPDGRNILFTRVAASQAWDDAEGVVEDLESHERTTVVRGGSDARYVATGHIVYGRGGELLALPFDLKTRKTDGTPVTVVSGIMEGQGATTGALHFDVSATGTLVYAAGASVDAYRLTWADLAGSQTPVIDDKGAYAYPRVSPDGSRLLFNLRVTGNNDVFALELARPAARIRLTTDPADDVSAIWSPLDGRRIVYASGAQGALNLYSRASDGSGGVERLTTSPNPQYPYSWSADGQTLLFVEQDPRNWFDIYALAINGDRKPVPLVATTFDERRPALSPDGRWLAYQSNEMGSFEIHVRPYPDVQRARHQASAGGGESPLWAPDGRALYYRQGSQILRVRVTTERAFSATRPEVVVSAVPDTPFWMGYDLFPDGKRFVVLTTDQGSAPRDYRLVLNWFEELKARVAPRQ